MIPHAALVARPALPVDLDEQSLNDFAERCVVAGFEAGVVACTGWDVGRAIMASILKQAGRPNTELAPSAHRALVSKWSSRVRKSLGWPAENPRKARPGRAPKKGAQTK